jgi:hypothetical protein
VERNDKGRKDLTAPLTFVLSRKGREEKKEFNRITLALPSPAAGRGENGDERNLTAPLTFILSRKGREEMEGKILKYPSPYPLPQSGEGR